MGLRTTILVVASVVLAMLPFAACDTGPTTTTQGGRSEPGAAATGSPKPNFVFILADDMRKDDLVYMPKTRALLGDKGMSFRNAYVSNALCCPSRATILRGQYAHNTGVWYNRDNLNAPDGGWEGFKAHGLEQDNLATSLDAAGYRTGLFGKYFNGYNKGNTHVPPGWTRWFAVFGFKYNGYEVNSNGNIIYFEPERENYVTDVLGRKTQGFIGTSVNRGKPFFAYVAPIAPHTPYDPAIRHRHAFDGEKAPRHPSFNEKDVSDKPSWVQSWPVLNHEQVAGIDDQQEGRAETLQALDELVEGIVDKLRAEGELSNTYIVFTSDNGYHAGEHRRPMGKTEPYEESSHMPLLVRGPDIEAGAVTEKLAANTDYLPTFTDLAGTHTPEYVDGRSLRSVLEGSEATWRSMILLERRLEVESEYSGPPFSGIVTDGRMKYVEYDNGERELYDLKADPYELTNLLHEPTPEAEAKAQELSVRLEALKSCSGDSCRAAEDGL